MSTLTALFTQYTALSWDQKMLIGVWTGSWAARTSLWPLAVWEARQKVRQSGTAAGPRDTAVHIATVFKRNATPWAVLKTSQWGSMATLGFDLVKSFLSMKPL